MRYYRGLYSANKALRTWSPLFLLLCFYFGDTKEPTRCSNDGMARIQQPSKGNFSLTTSNYSLFVFPFRERIVLPGNSWPHCLSYVVPDTASYKSLSGGGDMRNSPFPRKRGVCREGSLALLLFPLPSFDVNVLASVEQSHLVDMRQPKM